MPHGQDEDAGDTEARTGSGPPSTEAYYETIQSSGDFNPSKDIATNRENASHEATTMNIPTKGNVSYETVSSSIPTEENVAYESATKGNVTVASNILTEENIAYETAIRNAVYETVSNNISHEISSLPTGSDYETVT